MSIFNKASLFSVYYIEIKHHKTENVKVISPFAWKTQYGQRVCGTNDFHINQIKVR